MSEYLDSAIGVRIDRKRAQAELRKHGIYDFSEFYRDCGDRETYEASAVLRWLGY
jgi:hypothetical protein